MITKMGIKPGRFGAPLHQRHVGVALSTPRHTIGLASKRPMREPLRIAVVKATRAETDEQLLQSWLNLLSSPHTRRNFETTARRVLAGLPMGLREATVEDVRTALRRAK